VHCETFDGQPLAVALSGIVRALELLPRPDASGREAAEYNRRSGAVHDFLLEWAAQRWGVSDTLAGLAALRGQFAHRGRVPFRDEDPVPAGHWIGWFLGSGERPRHIDFTAMAVSEERLAAIFVGF
jgi:tryptophan halogenase